MADGLWNILWFTADVTITIIIIINKSKSVTLTVLQGHGSTDFQTAIRLPVPEGIPNRL